MRYLIKLKPLVPYFFGSEKTFGYNTGQNEQYIIHSSLLPQQSSILGMIRKEILIEQSNSPGNQFKIREDFNYTEQDWKNMNTWIGSESFNISKNNQKFGVIKEISPVFIINHITPNKYYMPLPFDHDFSDDKRNSFNPMERSREKTSVLLDNTKSTCLPVGYNAKTWPYMGNYWLELNSEDANYNHIVSKEELFYSDERIGINKNVSGTTSTDSFFKHTYANLGCDYSFAFILDADFQLKEQNIVYLGGERSIFDLSFETFSQKFEDLIPKFDNFDKIILWSDTQVENEVLHKYVDFAICMEVDFRNLQLKQKECHDCGTASKYRRAENKYGFLKRGSVLYTNHSEELKNDIRSFKNLLQIGYNIVD